MNIDNLCLGILSMGKASGYEIKRAFEQSFSHFQAASYGSIYPALAKLTDAGFARFREEPQRKRPTKKIFSITPSGREHFFQVLMQTAPTDQYRSDFLVLMMFAHLQPVERLRELLQQQADNLRAELEILQQIFTECAELTVGMRFTLEYGIAAHQSLLSLMDKRSESLLKELVDERGAAAS